MPAVDAGDREHGVRRGERLRRSHNERLGEEPVAELVRAADRAQTGVEDGDAVAEPLGLLEPVGGEKDGDAAFAQTVD